MDVTNHTRPRWVDGTPMIYKQFWHGEPNNAFGKEFCGSIYYQCGKPKGSKWNDSPCTESLPSVCKYTLKEETTSTETSPPSTEVPNICLEVFDRPDCSAEADRRLFKSGCAEADCCNYPDSSDLCLKFQRKARSYRACEVSPKIQANSSEPDSIPFWKDYAIPVIVVTGGSTPFIICCWIFIIRSRKKGKNVSGNYYVSDVEGTPLVAPSQKLQEALPRVQPSESLKNYTKNERIGEGKLS